MELMVAMAITTIIVTVLVSITSIALDTWNRSRSELRAARQAKGMLDLISRDFEAFVSRRGNSNEWLSAVTETKEIGDKLKSTNRSKLMFFSAVTDRYNGQLYGPDNIQDTSDDPPGGDVSFVAYELDYKDPFTGSRSSDFSTFVLNRLVVDPDDAFRDMMGRTALADTLSTTPTPPVKGPKVSPKDKKYSEQLSHSTNFVVENIYQFTVTFHVEVLDSTTTPPVTKIESVTMGKSATTFSVGGKEIVTIPPNPRLSAGRLVAVEISTTVISDFGVDQARRRDLSDPTKRAAFLAQNSYQYTKLVQLPSM